MINRRLWVATRSINEWVHFSDYHVAMDDYRKKSLGMRQTPALSIQIHDINGSNVILRMEMDTGIIPEITPNVPKELLCVPGNTFRDDG